MTCGLMAHRLNTVKGTSEIFKGSIVCYDEEVKIKLLKVGKNLIKEYTAESREVTNALAKNLKKLISADIYASITGLANSGGSESKAKPVGTVFFTVFWNNKLFTLKRRFTGTPLQIKIGSCDTIFEFIYKVLKKN